MVDRLMMTFVAMILTLGCAPAFGGALHDTVRSGGMSVAVKLLEQGANLNGLDEDGETPLTAAALAGRQEMVKLLLDHGAGTMVRNAGGFTVLHAAAYAGHRQIVELVLARGTEIDDQNNKAKITALHAAAERNHVDIATQLVGGGARIDIKELNGWTPLARATFKRYREMVLFLRGHGGECPTVKEVGPAHSDYCRHPSNN